MPPRAAACGMISAMRDTCAQLLAQHAGNVQPRAEQASELFSAGRPGQGVCGVRNRPFATLQDLSAVTAVQLANNTPNSSVVYLASKTDNWIQTGTHCCRFFLRMLQVGAPAVQAAAPESVHPAAAEACPEDQVPHADCVGPDWRVRHQVSKPSTALLFSPTLHQSVHTRVQHAHKVVVLATPFLQWPPWQERQLQHSHMVPPSVLCREVGLLKINVERAEWDVLAGIQPQDWPKVSARTRRQQQHPD